MQGGSTAHCTPLIFKADSSNGNSEPTARYVHRYASVSSMFICQAATAFSTHWIKHQEKSGGRSVRLEVFSGNASMTSQTTSTPPPFYTRITFTLVPEMAACIPSIRQTENLFGAIRQRI